jgi:hypothetical protein
MSIYISIFKIFKFRFYIKGFLKEKCIFLKKCIKNLLIARKKIKNFDFEV